MKYRSEIDGLRALAVVPVILFHAGFKAFSGGFVGVDVFFVISGYLITTILLNELEAGNFSIVRFYERRARRILPALFFIMFLCLPFAWFWLLPQDMKSFSQSLVAVSVFASNILFWRTSGYFDTATELKPLIHTWSLSVEEQYYVLFPLFLLFAWRLGKRRIAGLLAIVAVISLACAQWGAFNKPAATFYLLPTRAWELLIGAFIAFYYTEHNIKKHKHWHAEIGSALGFALIAYSIFYFSKQTPFPSLYALAPTIGAALIIVFATHKTLVGKLLGSKPFIAIGLISYSAYLWHQPMFAFARHRSLDEPSAWLMAALAIASIPLAYLTWRFVERPFRNKHHFSRKQVFAFALIGSFMFGGIGFIGHFSKGFPLRIPNNIISTEDQLPRIDNGWCFYSIDTISSLQHGKEGLQCWIGSKSPKFKGLLFGDSYAGQYEPLFDLVGKNYGLGINSVTTNWCFPTSTDEFTGPPSSPALEQCLFNRKFLLQNISTYDFVIFSGSWGSVLSQNKLSGTLNLIKHAAEHNKLVVIMASPIQYDANPLAIYQKSILHNDTFDISKFTKSRDRIDQEANKTLQDEAKKYKNVVFVDRDSIFGSSETNLGKPLSLDGGHISIFGSKSAYNTFVTSSLLSTLISRIMNLNYSKPTVLQP